MYLKHTLNRRCRHCNRIQFCVNVLFVFIICERVALLIKLLVIRGLVFRNVRTLRTKQKIRNKYFVVTVYKYLWLIIMICYGGHYRALLTIE